MNLLTCLCCVVAPALALAAEIPAFRPPAVPLVTHDPYFSIWSASDTLPESWPRHWTGATNGMCGLIRVDGKTRRWMGAFDGTPEVARQTRLLVGPTQTSYSFTADGVTLEVTFTSPLLPHDLEVFARPVTYVQATVASADGNAHMVSLYLDIFGEACVDRPKQEVKWHRLTVPGISAGAMGSSEQPVLKKSGDDLRIDWGHVILAGDGTLALGSDKACRMSFQQSGTLPKKDDTAMPRPADKDWPVIALTASLGNVTAGAGKTATFLIAYDDGPAAIEWVGKPLQSWWKRKGAKIEELLALAWKERDALLSTCSLYDEELTGAQISLGGAEYSQIASLAFRQAWAAHKLVAGPNGEPWFFSKENFSNGCIATVDVTYPSAPLMLLLNPVLLKGLCTPIFEYAQSGSWPYNYAPHDLGTYPKANGQVYGMGKKEDDGGRMPVEECGNMLLLAAAISHAEGNADYAKRYWPSLETWAAYLEKVGVDPNNQLCTDDFAGHLAHNANLSLKTITALGGYAQMCASVGKQDQATKFKKLAQQMVQDWMKAADDGDHYRLAFDKPGSWSQKYNMVWDRILGLQLFPKEIAAKELAHYRKVQGKYGLPLDSRKTYTKSDWLVWSATMTGNREDFEALIKPLYRALHESPSRVPMGDWYETKDAKKVGFQARSVVGGVFIPFLYDRTQWDFWRKRVK